MEFTKLSIKVQADHVQSDTSSPLTPSPKSQYGCWFPQAGFESRITCDSDAAPSHLTLNCVVSDLWTSFSVLNTPVRFVVVLTYLCSSSSWINGMGITFNKTVLCNIISSPCEHVLSQLIILGMMPYTGQLLCIIIINSHIILNESRCESTVIETISLWWYHLNVYCHLCV